MRQGVSPYLSAWLPSVMDCHLEVQVRETLPSSECPITAQKPNKHQALRWLSHLSRSSLISFFLGGGRGGQAGLELAM